MTYPGNRLRGLTVLGGGVIGVENLPNANHRQEEKRLQGDLRTETWSS